MQYYRVTCSRTSSIWRGTSLYEDVKTLDDSKERLYNERIGQDYKKPVASFLTKVGQVVVSAQSQYEQGTAYYWYVQRICKLYTFFLIYYALYIVYTYTFHDIYKYILCVIYTIEIYK
jgi:hypothetical protein